MLLLFCCRVICQENVRQDHLTTKANFVRMVVEGTREGLNYFLPRVQITTQATSQWEVKDPEYNVVQHKDFAGMFERLTKRTPLQLRLPSIELTRLDGTVLKGILVWAEHWNPTPGIP